FATLMVSLAILVATGFLFMQVPKGFIPNEDQSAIFTLTEASQGISFEAMVEHQKAVAQIVRADPAVKSLFATVVGTNAGAGSTTNQGRVFIHLQPRSERRNVFDIMSELRPKVAVVPGLRTFMQELPTIRIGGQLTKSQYQFTLQSPNTQELYRGAAELEA